MLRHGGAASFDSGTGHEPGESVGQHLQRQDGYLAMTEFQNVTGDFPRCIPIVDAHRRNSRKFAHIDGNGRQLSPEDAFDDRTMVRNRVENETVDGYFIDRRYSGDILDRR